MPETLETEVLVVGGGMAGTVAAAPADCARSSGAWASQPAPLTRITAGRKHRLQPAGRPSAVRTPQPVAGEGR
jgi:hypothetical protein